MYDVSLQVKWVQNRKNLAETFGPTVLALVHPLELSHLPSLDSLGISSINSIELLLPDEIPEAQSCLCHREVSLSGPHTIMKAFNNLK